MPTGAAATSVCGGASALRVVMLSLHTSPLTQAGSGDAGGMNVYIDALSRSLRAAGVSIDIITTDAETGGCHTASTPAAAASGWKPHMRDSQVNDAVRADSIRNGRDTVRVLPDGRRVHALHIAPETAGDKNRLVAQAEAIASRGLASLRAVDHSAVTTVHSHYWISGLAGLRMAEELAQLQSTAVPLIHTMHTIGAVKAESDPHTVEDPRRNDAEAAIAARADALTASTDGEIADLQRLFGVSAERIAMVEPGVDLGVFHPPHAPDPRTQMFRRPLRLTFAGRLQMHKGPQVAVAAAAQLRHRFPDRPVELVVAGRQSGPDTLDITRLAEAYGVADLVRTVEPLPHPELAELFRSSDAVLVPSYSESFGLVALEAMACGTPVVAHDVGGLSSLVIHDRTGLLVSSLDPADWAAQIRRLTRDQAGWQRRSSTAAAVAQSYSWAATANSTLTVYRSLSPAYAG